MKLKQYIIENKKYQIYIDLDGVLCDFLKGVSDIEGYHIKSFSEWSKIKKTEWKTIADAGSNFWANLEWMVDGKQLWNFIKEYNPHILSAFPTHPDNKSHAIKGKNTWIKKNLTKYDKIYLVKGIDKQKYANSNSILIDDSERNIKQWISKGGIGILHKTTSDTIEQLKRIFSET